MNRKAIMAACLAIAFAMVLAVTATSESAAFDYVDPDEYYEEEVVINPGDIDDLLGFDIPGLDDMPVYDFSEVLISGTISDVRTISAGQAAVLNGEITFTGNGKLVIESGAALVYGQNFSVTADGDVFDMKEGSVIGVQGMDYYLPMPADTVISLEGTMSYSNVASEAEAGYYSTISLDLGTGSVLSSGGASITGTDGPEIQFMSGMEVTEDDFGMAFSLTIDIGPSSSADGAYQYEFSGIEADIKVAIGSAGIAITGSAGGDAYIRMPGLSITAGDNEASISNLHMEVKSIDESGNITFTMGIDSMDATAMIVDGTTTTSSSIDMQGLSLSGTMTYSSGGLSFGDDITSIPAGMDMDADMRISSLDVSYSVEDSRYPEWSQGGNLSLSGVSGGLGITDGETEADFRADAVNLIGSGMIMYYMGDGPEYTDTSGGYTDIVSLTARNITGALSNERSTRISTLNIGSADADVEYSAEDGKIDGELDVSDIKLTFRTDSGTGESGLTASVGSVNGNVSASMPADTMGTMAPPPAASPPRTSSSAAATASAWTWEGSTWTSPCPPGPTRSA